MAILDILFRWIHVTAAVLAVGGAFFIRFLLPRGLQLIDDPSRREELLLRCRRAFKMLVHPAILGLLVSGVYNTIRAWPKYKLDFSRTHVFWGPHLILGLIVMGISLWLLAGKTLRKNHRRWMASNVSLMLLTILMASAVKWARDDLVWSRVPEAARQRDYVPPAQPAPQPATVPSTQSAAP